MCTFFRISLDIFWRFALGDLELPTELTGLWLGFIDGGKNPSFQEKFICTLIEGLRELNVIVWNSNTLAADDFIGSGK